MRQAKIVVIVLVVAFSAIPAWIIGGGAIDNWQVRRVTKSLAQRFPVGMTLANAEKIAVSRYPRQHTDFTSIECEKGSHSTVPAYSSQGGPCIFAIEEIRNIGPVEAAVEFKLIFGSDNRLAKLVTNPVYTFL